MPGVPFTVVPLDKQFSQATYYVASYDGPDKISPSDDQKLRFYALFKQAKKVSIRLLQGVLQCDNGCAHVATFTFLHSLGTKQHRQTVHV